MRGKENLIRTLSVYKVAARYPGAVFGLALTHMCGIFAYTGQKNANEVLLDGLTSLEYRGYDSAGIFMPEKGGIRAVGAVSNLKKKIPADYAGTSGIAHLRWATHGEPTETNAHPHRDCLSNVWVVHNGIIENYKELKRDLESRGHVFLSATDTEIMAHLVEEEMSTGKDFEIAALSALNKVRGTYGMAIQSRSQPDVIVGARMGAPVVLGLGEGEHFIASDPSPILKHTRTVLFLEDGEMAVIRPHAYKLYKLGGQEVDRPGQEVDWSPEEAQKGGYEHFMLKEIMEQPEVIENTLRGRLLVEEAGVKLGGLESVKDKIAKIERVIIVACGTAYYAGLVGEYMIEEHAGLPVEVELGSEFRYRKPVLNQNTMLVAISQSGETADTLEAIREGKRRGALTIGICNTVGSTIARETDAGVYNHAGPEIGVASTKALVSQVTALALLTVFLGRQRSMTGTDAAEIISQLQALPQKVQAILDRCGEIETLAAKYASARDFLFIGRKYNYPIAFEGALKLKELSYIHAEGCGAGEMKHGPLAMIDENFPTMAIAPTDTVYEKLASNIQEIRARKGPVVAIATEGNHDIESYTTDIIRIPETVEMLYPILTVVPLQLFAYYFAKAKGLDVDRPRNLAKSVTVE